MLDEWFQEGFAPYRSQEEFRNWGEYHDYIRKFDIRSLKGETVRSFEECEIANFLYLHGVAYEYEAPYEHDLATSEKAPVQTRLPSSRARHLYRTLRDRRCGEHGVFR